MPSPPAPAKTEAAIHADLRALGIVWKVLDHAPVFTVADSAAIHGQLPGAHTRNLFLKDSGGGFFLVTVDHATRVDLKALAPLLGATKLSFGKPEDMAALLGVSPGAVTPLAAIHDTQRAVTVVLDTGLAIAPAVHVHPMRNTATLGLPGADLVRVLAHWGHAPLIVTIPERT